MGNSNSQQQDDGTPTTNNTGENVINFNLFGGSDDEQVVVTRDFSLDLVDYVNYDDKFMDEKYPGWREQTEHFNALLDAFTKCNLDLETYYGKIDVSKDYSSTFFGTCPMNEYVKFRTGKYNNCMDGILPTPVRPLTEQEAKEIHRDLMYCSSSGSLDEDMSIFESRRMRWAEPGTLLQVRPKIMSMLKSRKFKPDSDDPSNIISNYYLEESDDEEILKEKLLHIGEQIGKAEYDEMMKCTSNAKDLDKECVVERQVYGLLVGTVLCKYDILKCLERNSSLHGTKLEEAASLDFANCVSLSTCFNNSTLNKL